MTRKTKKEQALETRERILDAAEDVFNECGVSRTALSDIAKAADVTRGAIYWHFKNKGDLFDAMCDRVREPMHNMIEAIADEQAENPLEQLVEGGLFFIAQVVNNPHYRKVFTIVHHKCEYLDESDPFSIYQRDWKIHVLSHLEKVLAYAQSKGQLPSNLDIPLASLTLHLMFSGLLNTWLFMPDHFNLLETTSKVLNTNIHSLKTSPALLKPKTNTE